VEKSAGLRAWVTAVGFHLLRQMLGILAIIFPLVFKIIS
jgi:hypothetical protein